MNATANNLTKEQLLTDYSPPLDASLVHAIISDYPITIEGLNQAQQILKSLLLSNQAENSIEDIKTKEELSFDNIEIDKHLDQWSIERTQIESVGFDSVDGHNANDESNVSIDEIESDQIMSKELNQDKVSPISLLKSMFPFTSIEKLQESLELYSGTTDSLTAVVNSLLNPTSIIETIANDNDDQNKKIEIPSKIKKKNYQRYHLNDVLRRDERIRLEQAKKKFIEDHNSDESITCENRWVTTDSEVLYLSRLLQMDPKIITSTYTRNLYNSVLSIEEILNKLFSERINIINVNEGNLKNLQELLPELNSSFLKQILLINFNDILSSFELSKFLIDLFKRNGTPLYNLFHRVPNQINQQHNKNQSKEEEMNSIVDSNDDQNWRMMKGSNNNNNRQQIKSNNLTEAKCLEKVEYYQKLRNEAFKKATLNFKKSSGISLIHAEQGRQFDLKSKFWELEAGKLKVLERKKHHHHYQHINSIDLHGLNRNQALAVTQESLNNWWSSDKRSTPLIIITGAGTHSISSKPILLPAISRYLTREHWNWRFQSSFNGGPIGAIIVLGLSN
ncbi:hypothetical protein CROQUDRAFT_654063 [Cronartium quercuum f. sp. fusiforme G11]|uniref:Smr domain-containing protein n=1 Tax=Cronartium quercuum f. sp. fusiforme G11 TaxID=708437 RepID=A0A9P6TEQ9_9BASI|nr:hypothetical protein CROQUDRAFT_654063 [Cronartium quercuum f. sp. fusiforme G11]